MISQLTASQKVYRLTDPNKPIIGQKVFVHNQIHQFVNLNRPQQTSLMIFLTIKIPWSNQPRRDRKMPAPAGR